MPHPAMSGRRSVWLNAPDSLADVAPIRATLSTRKIQIPNANVAYAGIPPVVRPDWDASDSMC